MSHKRKIYIGFSNSNSIISKIICFITRFKYSHTYIRFEIDGCDVPIVAHADKYFVFCENYFRFLKRVNNIEEFYFYCDDEKYNYIKNFIFNKCGVKYSYSQIFGILILLLFKYGLKLKINNPLSNNDVGYICTEFVSEIIGLDNKEDNTIQDIYYYCKKNYFKEGVYM